MANKYANLVGTNKIKDEYKKINTGFDGVEVDVNATNARIDNLVSQSGDSNTEIVDARQSTVKSKTFATLDARLEEAEQDHKTHTAEKASDAAGVHGLVIESGTWTPILSGGTHTYAGQTGLYYKIGSQVFVCGSVSLSAKGVVSEHLSIGGLPFAFPSANNLLASATISYAFLSLPAGDLGVYGAFVANRIYLYRLRNNAVMAVFGSDNLQATTNIMFSGTYLV